MRSQTLGDKPAFVEDMARNDEASTTILRGQVGVLTLDGTEDGLAVVLPATAGAAKTNSVAFGIATKDTASADLNNFSRAGLNRYTILRSQTRAATTDSWNSFASQAIGVTCGIDTVNNCMSIGGGTVGSSGYLPMCVIAETLASYASSASATSDTRTAITTSAKSFLRML